MRGRRRVRVDGHDAHLPASHVGERAHHVHPEDRDALFKLRDYDDPKKKDDYREAVEREQAAWRSAEAAAETLRSLRADLQKIPTGRASTGPPTAAPLP